MNYNILEGVSLKSLERQKNDVFELVLFVFFIAAIYHGIILRQIPNNGGLLFYVFFAALAIHCGLAMLYLLLGKRTSVFSDLPGYVIENRTSQILAKCVFLLSRFNVLLLPMFAFAIQSAYRQDYFKTCFIAVVAIWILTGALFYIKITIGLIPSVLLNNHDRIISISYDPCHLNIDSPIVQLNAFFIVQESFNPEDSSYFYKSTQCSISTSNLGQQQIQLPSEYINTRLRDIYFLGISSSHYLGCSLYVSSEPANYCFK